MYKSFITWQWHEELEAVWKQLEISSCYGQHAFQQQTIYTGECKNELSLAFDELTVFINGLRMHPEKGVALLDFFRGIPDIRSELNLLNTGYGLRHEAYFKLKLFLLAHEKIEKEIYPWLRSLSLKSIELLSLQPCLAVLDPSNQRLPTFFLDGGFSEKLAELRSLKRRVEQRLRTLKEENDVTEWTERRNEVLRVETQEEEKALALLQKQLDPYAKAWQQYLQQLGALELLLAKARLALRKEMVRPVISDDESLTFSGLRHPIVEGLLQQKKRTYQAIDIECCAGSTVITGANMGGKSVTLRAIMINCLLFQMGYFVFAKEAKLPLFDHLTLLDEVRQSIHQGMSSFAMEVCQFQQHVEAHNGKFVLLMLDEFGRSTNPQEGSALMQAVTHYMQQQPGVTLIATHYDDVAAEAGAHYQVIGFSQLSTEQFRQAFEQGRNPLQVLQDYMDYRLEPASDLQRVPQEARLICKAFRLEPDIMSFMENKITKRNP